MSARNLGNVDQALISLLSDFERRITAVERRRPSGEGVSGILSFPTVPIVNIVLLKGDDVVITITCRDRETNALINWTGWTHTARFLTATGILLATGTVSNNGAGGVLTVFWPSSQTSGLSIGQTGTWELVGLSPASLTQTIVLGSVIVQGA